jgi:hypothetical protein
MDLNNDNNILSIDKCFIILDINLDDIELTKINHDFLRKKYHKMALKWHPDKNKNMDQNYVKERFQEINQAYEYLCKELDLINNNNINANFVSLDTNIYVNLLTLFISSIIEGNYKDTLVILIKEIITSSKDYLHTILKNKFDSLDKDNILEIYRFLYKYKDILNINNDILDFVSLQIKEKYKNNQIIILNPTIDDIINNNIYKLYVDNNLYLVPLWHNELYFDNPNDKDNDLIVLCQPELDENIIIDENNNINYNLFIKFDKIELLDKPYIDFNIGNKYFKIPIQKLNIKKEQYYTLKNQGISRLIENDIYNVNLRNDIIIKVIFI